MIESRYIQQILKEDADVFKVSTSWGEKKFNVFNEKYFDGRLPKPEFKLVRTKTKHASCTTHYIRSTGKMTFTINLSIYYNKCSEWQMENFLIHEMIHECNYHDKGFMYMTEENKKYRTGGHGPSFKKEMERINSIGEHKIMIVGTVGEDGEEVYSAYLKDYEKELKENVFVVMINDNAMYGTVVSNKMVSMVLPRLQKFNVFVCKIKDPNIFIKFPRIFRRNQHLVGGNLNGDNSPEKLIGSNKIEVEDVYIKNNCKLMYKPKIYTLEYMKDPQSYIENGDENMKSESVIKTIKENYSRKRKKNMDEIDLETMKKLYNEVEVNDDEIIIDII